MLAEPLYNSFAHQHHSYLARGRYHEQLERWRALFDDRQLLVLSSERFFSDPERTFAQVLDFLELPAFTPDGFEKHNGYDYRRMGDEIHARLAEHYREPNRRLYASLGDDLGWTA
jgi:hypothetical protein